jgi:hypothetical protein
MSNHKPPDQQDHRLQAWDNPQQSSPQPRPIQRWYAGQTAYLLGVTLRNLSLMVAGGMTLMTLFILLGVWRSGNRFIEGIHALLTAPQPAAKVDVRSMVVRQVRSASELTTAIFAMESVVPTSRERTVGGYVIGKTTLLYIAYGEVRAGVDLTALKAEDVQVNGDNTITLRLPPPKILDSKIDVNRSKVYDYDRGFMGLGPDVAPELQELAQRETLQKIVQSACTAGVLQSANDRAKLAVGQLLNTAGYAQFSVETQPALADACTQSTPPSSNPGDAGGGAPGAEKPAQPETQPAI